jgi:hypothetical protein
MVGETRKESVIELKSEWENVSHRKGLSSNAEAAMVLRSLEECQYVETKS